MVLEKTYQYKIYRDGVYLGNLPNVVSPFSYSQRINTAGAQLTVEINRSADQSDLPLEAIMDEDGNAILDEDGNAILEERRPEIFGDSEPNAMIRNENEIKVYEYSDENPNGLLVFDGWITTIDGEYGGKDNIVITCLSKGADLSEYVFQGSPYVADVSQATQNSSALIGYTSVLFSPPRTLFYGQTFQVGGSVTNVGAIDLYLDNSPGTTDAIIKVILFDSVATAQSNGTPLGEVSRYISTNGVQRFTFASPITVTPGSTLFFVVNVVNEFSNTGINFKTGNPYAAGQMYYNDTATNNWLPYGDGTSDLYFVTYSNAGALSAAFSAYDPTNILKALIDNYASQGGYARYSSSTDDTGLSVTYTFKQTTALQGVEKCLELAPSDWFWYVDPGSTIIYFKQASTTPDHIFIKGRHLEKLRIRKTSDNIRNKIYFSGGDTGGGSNLLKTYSNPDSESPRQRLALMSDNRVTLSATADTLADNLLDAEAEQDYQTTVVIAYPKYDISTINIGDMVKLVGFSDWVETLLLQVANKTPHPDGIQLTLGSLEPRQSTLQAQLLKDIALLQTVDNPTTPS